MRAWLKKAIYLAGVYVIIGWMCLVWLIVSALAWLAGERQ